LFKKRRLVGLGVGALFLASLVPAPATAVAVAGGDKLYTTDADFDQGTLVDVNHDSPNNDQLQLDKVTTPFPFVNVAASGRGTAIRINVNTGQIVGEYRTAPAGQAANPSRTTVDKLGNVWVTNRDQSSGGKGSVARIGIVQGGTRTLADGTPDPTGQFLSGPFAYNTCLDRDSDGLLRTSLGLTNILPWTNAGGVDTNGGVATAQDECIINYTRVTGTNARTVAVDANNDVWVGGLGNLNHEKLSGATGQPIAGTQFNLGCGGYGGFVHPNGTLWSARGGNGLLRYNTAFPVATMDSGSTRTRVRCGIRSCLATESRSWTRTETSSASSLTATAKPRVSRWTSSVTSGLPTRCSERPPSGT
jgi:streptogramin lyase